MLIDDKKSLKTNFVVFLIDGLRYDQIHGEQKESFTPNIDSLIEKGTFFTNSFSCVDGTILSLNTIFNSVFSCRTGNRARQIFFKENNIFDILKKSDYELYGLVPKMKIYEPSVKSIYFDSQNLAFWDAINGVYRLYFRYWPDDRRDIMMMTSSDFINWVNPVRLKYPGARPDHLYTSQIKPYYRAPHILIGFPTRFINDGWTDSTRALPEFLERRQRAGSHVDTENEGVELHFSSAITEAVFMSSRDGQTFKRWDEAFLRPGIERKGSWAYGNQYIAWQVVETESEFEDAPNELSLYATEGNWTGTSSQLRRYTIRMDGFVSLHAPLSGGELVTKPLVFDGSEMVINFSSSAAGGVQVEIQDVSGEPIEGFTLADCPPVFGDSIERKVNWNNAPNLNKLSGQPVRLRFVCKDADLYYFRFRPGS